jgi:hypothetical protein
MGTRFRAAQREVGPCLCKAKGAPAVRVLRLPLHFVQGSLRMTAFSVTNFLTNFRMTACPGREF